MWKCKKCGNDTFYQPTRSRFIIYSADKNENIIGCDDDCNVEYGKFYCENCKKTGWRLSDVAKWIEEEENEM
ncbi:hypothetical protein IX329_000761 [Fusobacterium necrophorum]|nr:hypothetical protein [Fusobacterium necrophorum]MBR8733188.1 hypothetical protein [Fusobacterium necrophorum]MBR8789268.1 hypothetical protein [Fusobacterium necrophorum]